MTSMRTVSRGTGVFRVPVPRRFLPLVLLVFVFAMAARPAAAQDLSEAQFWFQFLNIGQLDERWRSHVEVQPRLMHDGSELGLTLVRSALGRQVHPRVSIWGGYAWVPRTLGRGVQHEQRAWEQLLLTPPVKNRWVSTVRLRVEQRWLDPWQDNSHRVRTLVRFQRPITETGIWSVATYDEAMFTIDRTPLGPPKGYDRNRLYVGVVRRISPAVSFEAGYIWENSTVRGSVRRNDHVTIGVFNLSAPRLR